MSKQDSDDGKIDELLKALEEEKPEESSTNYTIKKIKEMDEKYAKQYDSYEDTTKEDWKDDDIPEEAYFD